MKILHIETSTELCSVALSDDNECIALKENSEGRNHASLLTVFIEDIFREQQLSAKDFDAVSVSAGPGSYTGLRIGVSTAKGICYGADIPLISVSTLHAMSVGFVRQNPDTGNALLCPMIDARRMEVYTALYDSKGEIRKDVSAEIITADSFAEWLDHHIIYFFGNGAEKCSDTLTHPNAVFIPDFNHSARFMIDDAVKAYQTGRFEDTAYFEPFYLKDFIAGKAKKLTDLIGY